MDSEDRWFDEWDRQRRMAVVQVVCYIVHTINMQKLLASNVIDSPISYPSDINKRRMAFRNELMRSLYENGSNAKDVLRMTPYAFLQLCSLLRESGRVVDNRNSTVEEKVAKFLWCFGHQMKNRNIKLIFRRSGETVSRHFHEVLKAVINLEDTFLKQPIGRDVPAEILNNTRFYPYFQNAIGAIDGSHFRVKVPIADAPKYRGRKDWPTQNVLAACGFDMRFTYVLTGWEGTASDSRIVKNALARADKLTIPRGKYYLVDGGYMLRSGLLTPFRGVRYHLKEYATHGPENAQELFNHRHASLRNVIERAFGVLKKRFPIIRSGSEASYPVDTVSLIVLACSILHNFILGVDPNDEILTEGGEDEMDDQMTEVGTHEDNHDSEYNRGQMLRNDIMNQMWQDYNIIRNNLA